ncbi:glycerophosphodiester phosphodiesterase [Clostridium sp. B9]|uniref:glycerophosphodiester phosphodiesterase n=1 Tax=Clostridium sp. B9 TaxID=3423224 RepID=UPI003D2F4DD7
MNIFAHRGFSGKYPENTLLAFKEALKLDIDGIELDVHKSKDGKLVVIHDEDVKRTFQGNGEIKNLNYDELLKLKCSKNGFEENLECRIPLLEEVLDLIKDRDIILNIEIKNDIVSYDNIEFDVLNLIKKYEVKNKILISSFNHKALRRVKELQGDINIGVLYEEEIPNVIEYAKEIGAYAIHPCKSLITDEIVKEAHDNNIKVNVYTVNKEADVKRLNSWNVDGIFTDYSDNAVEILK